MLRQSLVHKAMLAAGNKRFMMVAATSAQKRALNKSQLEGDAGSSAPPPPSAPPAAESSNLLPIAAVGLVGAGGAAYYYWNNQAPAVEEPVVTRDTSVASSSSKTKEAEAATAVEKNTAVVETVTEKKDETPAAPTKETTENRVTSIQIPAKMKNQAATALASVAAHPETGHRVSMSPPQTTAAAKENSSMTTKALSQLRSQQTQEAAAALLESHQTVWATMDAQYFSDLDTLNSSQLKARIVQLASEMKDRTKWEAVRLKEFLAMKEKEVSDKYMEIMQKQRLELEDLAAKQLREKETEMSGRMLQALQEKEASIQNVLQTALEAQKAEHDADMKTFAEVTTAEIESTAKDKFEALLLDFKEKAARDLEEKVAALDSLTQKISELEAALETTQSNKEGSLRAHRVSAAALALAEKLETNESATMELQALKKAAGSDGVIATALATIPDAVVASGVPTLSDLQARFDSVYKKCRQAALVPAGRPGLEGQLAGMMFAAVKYPPNADDAAPEEEKDNPEYVLVRAKKNVQLGHLEQAVSQLEKLDGQAAFTAADWKNAAMQRVSVEKALKVVKMECALLNESLVE